MKLCVCIILLVVLSTTSCTKPGCIGKAGNRQTQTRTVGAFSQVRLEDNINLVLVQGNSNVAELTGPVNILDNIGTDVVDGVLILRNQNSCRWARDPDEKITVRLQFTGLNKLEYAGSGSVSNEDTLRLDALLVESYDGAGDVELTVDNRYTGVFVHLENASVTMHGKTQQCNTYTNSRGLTNLGDLLAKSMTIEYGGLGDTFINVSGQLDAMIFYKGNVFYKGSPVITRAVSYSTGKLISKP